jgi:hypothetical protein
LGDAAKGTQNCASSGGAIRREPLTSGGSRDGKVEGWNMLIWPKALMEELENNTRKPRDLTKNRHSDSLKKGQLTLPQGMLKKGEDIAVDDYDDAVRTSVSRN